MNASLDERPKVEGVGIKGFYRVQITEPDKEGKQKIVGDSGWKGNQVTNLGFNWYLAGLLGDIASSSQISYVALGTGGVPGAADTVLAGEVEVRTAVTAATSSTSKRVRFTATFGSGGNFVTKVEAISNIGLFRSLAGGTLFAGNVYASSNVATNQNVQVTYDIDFS